MMFGFDTVIVQKRASAGVCGRICKIRVGPTKPTKKKRLWLVDEIRKLPNEYAPRTVWSLHNKPAARVLTDLRLVVELNA
jgi:hypothetical protein